VSLSQIGEFSFILTSLGLDLRLLTDSGRDLVLAGAMLSILANPIFFALLERIMPWLRQREPHAVPEVSMPPEPQELRTTTLKNHAILVGHGRVGSLVADTLKQNGQPILVIEERQEIVNELRSRGIEVIAGNANQSGLLEAANVGGARWLISAIPNPFENSNLIEHARAVNPKIENIARAHSDDEVAHLKKFGADLIVMGEREIARGMAGHILSRIERDRRGTVRTRSGAKQAARDSR
jgi:CPA2 family monovalent cation:H+ antiporter-2